MSDEFYTAIDYQAFRNQDKWGKQEPEVVFRVLVEEIGEIARALLNTYSENLVKDGSINLKKECVDAAAVLLNIWERADEFLKGGEGERRG